MAGKRLRNGPSPLPTNKRRYKRPATRTTNSNDATRGGTSQPSQWQSRRPAAHTTNGSDATQRRTTRSSVTFLSNDGMVGSPEPVVNGRDTANSEPSSAQSPQAAGRTPTDYTTQSLGLDSSPTTGRHRQPRKNSGLKARFQDVVRIIFRQNKIRKLTAPFALPPDSDLTLCRTCADLNWVPQDFMMGPTDKTYGGRVKLGSFIGICAKAHVCSLCRLIIKSIAEQPFAKLATVVHGRNTGSTLQDMNATCTAEWQTDGRSSNEHKTRRICIEWSENCFDTTWLVMVCPRMTLTASRPAIDPSFFGRRLEHVNETPFQLLKSWLQLCRDQHGPDCQAGDTERFHKLRRGTYFGVIDVDEMQFKPLPEGASYVALSYTWGPEKMERYRTMLKNVMTIMERNGLSQYHDKLPKTIRETIDLVRRLRLRYLWVDSICIVQDSKQAWERNAEVMDLVYGNAVLTICAADGEDADAGLSALSNHEERCPQAIESYSADLQLMARYPSEVYVRQTKWNTRAWTFQERLLSKRCLIFAQGRMFYQCRKTTMCEDVDLETPIIGESLDLEHSPGRNFKKSAEQPLAAYRTNVALYTARNLSKHEDILAAFYGIGNSICAHLGGEQVYGLPNSHFDWALLWEPRDAPERRQPGKILTFPSWSWCGWDKRCMEYKDHAVADFMEHMHDWLMNHTWITWYIRDGDGDLRLVWDAKRYSNTNTDLPKIAKPMRGYYIKGEQSPKQDYYGREIPTHMIGLRRKNFEKTIPEFPVQVRTLSPGPGEISPNEVNRHDRSILQFFTWSAYFKLEPESQSQPTAGDATLQGRIFSRRYKILDVNGTWAGTIVLDLKWRFDQSRPRHFIAISEAYKFWPEESKVNNNYTLTDEPWPVYNVLMLDYRDPSEESQSNDGDPRAYVDDDTEGPIAYRVGLGKIWQRAFDQACSTSHQPHRKEWREIVLG